MILPVLDDLTMLTSTVYLESAGEPFEGKLGVAWVVVNRMWDVKAGSVAEVVLAPWQFSAFNTDYRPRAKLSLASFGQGPVWQECAKASAAALFELLPDPTEGARHYLNVDVTKKIRGGTLPDWFDSAKVTVVIGRHTFLKL